MKHILAILAVLLLSAGIVSAQTDSSKRKKKQTTTTTTHQSSTQKKQTTESKSKKNSNSKRSNSANSSSRSNSSSANNSSLQDILSELSSNMVYVSGGTFTMGSTPEQGSDVFDTEKPAHSVYVSSFYICKYEVTQELWQAVMGNNPSNFKGNRNPVEQVSWNDCKTFISKLNSITGKKFRMPTEAEWEFAARGGIKSQGYKYSGSNTLGSVAWYTDNSGSATHEVGMKHHNELGIYDMSGNVYEWCSDWFDKYSRKSQKNPKGASRGSKRVGRGGSWHSTAISCRTPDRDGYDPDGRSINLGLRLALSE